MKNLPDSIQRKLDGKADNYEPEYRLPMPDVVRRAKQVRELSDVAISPETVRQLAMSGCTVERIANVLGISVDVFYKLKRTNPEFEFAYQSGRAEVLYKVEHGVMQRALNGDQRAASFVLSTQGGWTTKQHVELTGANGGPVELSAARQRLADKVFRKKAPAAIEHEGDPSAQDGHEPNDQDA